MHSGSTKKSHVLSSSEKIKKERLSIPEHSFLVLQFHSSTNMREFASVNKYQKLSLKHYVLHDCVTMNSGKENKTMP